MVVPLFGIRNNWRFAALTMVLLAAVAPVTAAQARTEAAAANAAAPLTVEVKSGLNFATFNVRTAAPRRVAVSFGTDRANLLPMPVQPLKRQHSIRLSPLAPNSLYFYSVTAMDAKGKALERVVRSFKTGPVRPATLSVVNGRFRLNGVPFFPVMARTFNLCPLEQVVQTHVNMRVNIMVSWGDLGKWCQSGGVVKDFTAEELHQRLNSRLWWLDLNGMPFDGLPEDLGFTGDLEWDSGIGTNVLLTCVVNNTRELYENLQKDSLRLRERGSALVGSYVVNERRSPNGPPRCTTPERLSAVFWTNALVASGIQYITGYHSAVTGEADVNPEVQLRARAEQNKLKALYPVLLTGVTLSASSSSTVVAVKFIRWGGSSYVLTLNMGPERLMASIKLPVVGTTKAHGFWGAKRKNIAKKTLTSTWEPYQLQVYRITK